MEVKEYELINEINKDELERLFNELPETMKKEIQEVKQKTKEILEDSEDFEEFKIYSLDNMEKIYYIKNYTNGLDNINLKEVKQIETDFYNNVYVLLENGNIYINSILEDVGIEKIYMLDGVHIYMITTDNKIIPLGEKEEWSKLDFYLYNNSSPYKKVVTDVLHIAGLTKDKRVVSAYCNPCGIGIDPENFINVDDILIKDEKIYIIKVGETKPLYIW